MLRRGRLGCMRGAVGGGGLILVLGPDLHKPFLALREEIEMTHTKPCSKSWIYLSLIPITTTY